MAVRARPAALARDVVRARPSCRPPPRPFVPTTVTAHHCHRHRRPRPLACRSGVAELWRWSAAASVKPGTALNEAPSTALPAPVWSSTIGATPSPSPWPSPSASTGGASAPAAERSAVWCFAPAAAGRSTVGGAAERIRRRQPHGVGRLVLFHGRRTACVGDLFFLHAGFAPHMGQPPSGPTPNRATVAALALPSTPTATRCPVALAVRRPAHDLRPPVRREALREQLRRRRRPAVHQDRHRHLGTASPASSGTPSRPRRRPPSSPPRLPGSRKSPASSMNAVASPPGLSRRSITSARIPAARDPSSRSRPARARRRRRRGSRSSPTPSPPSAPRRAAPPRAPRSPARARARRDPRPTAATVTRPPGAA